MLGKHLMKASWMLLIAAVTSAWWAAGVWRELVWDSAETTLLNPLVGMFAFFGTAAILAVICAYIRKDWDK